MEIAIDYKIINTYNVMQFVAPARQSRPQYFTARSFRELLDFS